MLTRRSFIALSAGFYAERLLAQGVATRSLKPLPRPALSGKPFLAHFTDVANAAGLTAPTIYGMPYSKEYILEAVGCGCAFIDYDNDGWMDVFILSGTRRQGAPPHTTNRLYKNNRNGTFSDVTDRAGLRHLGWASAVCVGDYNNDGFDDLFCTYFGQNILYRNNGDGTFTDVTKTSGLLNQKPRWGAGCAFLDYNRDGNLDLFISNYLQFDFDHVPSAGSNSNCNWKGVPVQCGPRGLPPGYHSLYRNNGDGTFTDVSHESGIAGLPRGYGMTAVAADFDDDGWPDIYLACDSTPSILLMNNRDGTFTEQGLLRGAALSEDGMEQAGMGVAVGDYDLDGHLDILKTHFSEDTDALYRNDGRGYFEEVCRATKLAVETRYVSWGAGIVDLDNDGFPDLFITTGGVYPQMDKRLPEYSSTSPRVLFRNLGDGTFEELIEEAGPGVSAKHCSRGCAFGDFDNDGDVDILIVNLNEPPSLLRNDLQGSNHWLKIKLIGTRSNRSAIGARVTVSYGGRRQAQEVMSQSSFYSCNDPRLHFGLGSEASADVEVRWPTGIREKFLKVPSNQLIVVKEGRGLQRTS